jgi:hypothetical protein
LGSDAALRAAPGGRGVSAGAAEGELQDGVDEPAFEPVAGPSAVVDGQVVQFGAGQGVDDVDLSRRGWELGPVAVSSAVRAWTSCRGLLAAGVPRRGNVRVGVCGGG